MKMRISVALHWVLFWTVSVERSVSFTLHKKGRCWSRARHPTTSLPLPFHGLSLLPHRASKEGQQEEVLSKANDGIAKEKLNLELRYEIPATTAASPLSNDSSSDTTSSSRRHLAIVVAGTLWWYIYTSATMLQSSSSLDTTSSTTTTLILALYVTLSQLLVYGGCYLLSKAPTLQQAQFLVVGMTMLCVPADLIATIVDPTGQKELTIVAFTEITLVFGTFLAHYLKKASEREMLQQQQETKLVQQSLSAAITTNGTPAVMEFTRIITTPEPTTIVEALQQYRPPLDMQATHMAADFTRSFVAFTIAAGALAQQVMAMGPQQLLLQLATTTTNEDDGSMVTILSLCIVVVHTATECTLTTVWPGCNLARFNSYLMAEIGLYAIHMVAASLATIQLSSFASSSRGDFIDQAQYIWLFGSATAKLLFKVQALLGKVDWDAKLGLK